MATVKVAKWAASELDVYREDWAEQPWIWDDDDDHAALMKAWDPATHRLHLPASREKKLDLANALTWWANSIDDSLRAGIYDDSEEKAIMRYVSTGMWNAAAKINRLAYAQRA